MSTHRTGHFRLLLLAGFICAWISSCGGSHDHSTDAPPAGCAGLEDLEFFPPAASVDAGADRTVEVGELVRLSASTAAEMIEWRIASKPEGSLSEIDDPTSRNASLIPDEVGIYEIEVAAGDLTLLEDPALSDEVLAYFIATDTVAVTAVAPGGEGGAGGVGGVGGAGAVGGAGGVGGAGAVHE